MLSKLLGAFHSPKRAEDSVSGGPRVSIVIISYNMAREVPRTVLSFLPPHQRHIQNEDVEIIVLENGSSVPIPNEVRSSWPDNVRYIEVEDPKPSPAYALNYGVSLARGDIVCPVIDGARMASPGLVSTALRALEYSEQVFVASIGLHLGSKLQQHAVNEGYNQQVEDELISSINWPDDGYRLFEICAPAGSSSSAWFGAIAESNAPFLRKSLYESIGGYDERFDIPGGGLVNLDFLSRLTRRSDADYFLVAGEATFHQFHGGVTTSRHVQLQEPDGETTWEKYAGQYANIRGEPYQHPTRRPTLFGSFPPEAARLAARVLEYIANERENRKK